MLTRESFDKYINEVYGVFGEQPWLQYPTNTVYRHRENKKWFGVVMTLPKTKLGLDDEATADVVNLKCDPLMVGSVVDNRGIFPGYHMNKNHWITVMLDGSVDDEKIRWLLDLSFDMTCPRTVRKKY